jgi:membrane-associated phospholipid phosphatase
VVVACLLAFALLAWQAVAETGLARVDVHVQHFVVRHRVGWLTDGFRALAWLGSVTVLALVLVVVGTVLLMTRRDALGAVLPAAALAGTIVAKNAAKALIERPRPSPASAIGSNAGFAFPSGHAADPLAAYVMLVMILSVGRSRPVRRALWFAATALVLVVGASRVYLGAQWSTDVLGGWALAGAIVAMLGRAFSLPRSPLPRDSPVTPRGGPART